MENLLNVSFPLNEAQWKTAARCYISGAFGYLRLCEAILLQQLINHYDTVINVSDWERDASPAELSFDAMVEVAFIYKSLNAWYSEVVAEMPDDDDGSGASYS